MKKETAPTLNDSDRALDGAAKAPSVGNMFANCIYKFDKLDHRAQLANQTVGVLLKGLKLSDIAKTYTKIQLLLLREREREPLCSNCIKALLSCLALFLFRFPKVFRFSFLFFFFFLFFSDT